MLQFFAKVAQGMTDTPRYTVQAAARAGGITEARLRTWERRNIRPGTTVEIR